jgi:hypothetical protein
VASSRSSRVRGSGAALVAAAVLVAPTARAASREVELPSLPENVVALIATADGGAWLLGKARDYPNRPELWRFDGSDRPPARIDVPGQREPLAIAWSPEDGRLWLAGYDFVGVRAGDRSFQFISIPSCDPGALVVIAPGRAALSRRGGNCPGEVLMLHDRPTLSAVSERLVGDGGIGSVISDGRGGIWAIAGAKRSGYPEHLTGYLHRSEGAWQAFMPNAAWPESLQPPPGLIVAGATPPELGLDWGTSFLVVDGAGGFYFLYARAEAFYRVSASGRAQRIDAARLPSPGATMFWNDVAFDETTHGLLFLTGGTRSRDTFGPESTERLRVAVFDGQRVVREEKLPSLPSWGRNEWVRGSVAGAGGTWWVAYGGLVLSTRAGGWTLFESQQMKARLEGERHRETLDTLSWLVPGTLGLAAMAAGGGFVASRIHGQAFLRATAPVLGGSLVGGLPATLMFDAATGYRADFAILTDLAGLLWGTALGGLATWGTGELVAPSRNRWAGMGGALGGALLGTALAFPLPEIFGRRSDWPSAAAVGLAAGLVGSFAAMGYQWAGGGPR